MVSKVLEFILKPSLSFNYFSESRRRAAISMCSVSIRFGPRRIRSWVDGRNVAAHEGSAVVCVGQILYAIQLRDFAYVTNRRHQENTLRFSDTRARSRVGGNRPARCFPDFQVRSFPRKRKIIKMFGEILAYFHR